MNDHFKINELINSLRIQNRVELKYKQLTTTEHDEGRHCPEIRKPIKAGDTKRHLTVEYGRASSRRAPAPPARCDLPAIIPQKNQLHRALAKRKENNIALTTLRLFTVSVPYLVIRQHYESLELSCKNQ